MVNIFKMSHKVRAGFILADLKATVYELLFRR